MNTGNFAPGFRAKISQLTQVNLYEEAPQTLLVSIQNRPILNEYSWTDKP
jgi:hypothetical protein